MTTALTRRPGRRTGLLAACLASLTCLAGAAGAVGYTLPGREVAVYDLVGTVRVEPGTGSAVTAEVTTAGRDAGMLRVETGVLGGRQTLRVIFPRGDVIYPGGWPGGIRGWSSTQIAVRADGRFNDHSMSGLGELLGRRVRIRASGRGTEAHADLVVRVPRGMRVSVYNGMGRISAANVEAELRLDGSATTVDARGIHGALTVDVGSGNVSVSGVDGALLVDTGSGDVSVSRIKASSVKLDTGSGTVEGDQVTAASLLVDTGSGGVRLSDVNSPDVYCDTGSGSVTLGLAGVVGKVRIDTGSGGVDLVVPADTGARLSADCGSGDITCDLPIRVQHRDDDSVSGCLGNCRGSIRIDTGSGDIHVRSGSGAVSAGAM
jgi:lia operon protein LiaG